MYNETMNVITRYRKDAGLTEQELADKSGVTRNYIVKLEQTVYRSPSEKVTNYLAEATYGSTSEIVTEYDEDFRRKQDHMDALEPPDWDLIKSSLSVLLNQKPETHPFVLLRQLLSDHYLMPGSQIKWATTFNIHPAELSKYELGKTINMPSSVVRSLVRLGCPTELLGFVDARVHEWANND